MVQALSPSLEATDSQGLGKPWMTGSPHFLLGKSRRGTAQMREEGAWSRSHAPSEAGSRPGSLEHGFGRRGGGQGPSVASAPPVTLTDDSS